MSQLKTAIELLESASVDVKSEYEVILIGRDGNTRKDYESREQHLEGLIKAASQLLQEYNDEETTFGEELLFVVTKLTFACGTVKYSLQAYSGFGDELDFGMFESKEEAYERKDYYTTNDADYAELDLAEIYGLEEGGCGL
ncbi:hypothetical protein [Bacillus thuringiensis]|uniref:hypothetical protein n=1 Tax=Bacillus thuringiensis TaxID=1428 RepID=UPI0026E1D2FA|nr:hypothetical protein [Bacillus thuringiensis]MDO6634122.1 hypothetical protein [Bacillus thuringiensis]MDO6663556.1 hypothetical protein [Bacillus thuringiensis]MDO6704271.1 hypothetical protein [Bacillus thuringiensis]